MANSTIQEILNKPWLDVNEIQILMNCGRNQAYKIANDIRLYTKQNNYRLNGYLLNTNLALKYIQINYGILLNYCYPHEEELTHD